MRSSLRRPALLAALLLAGIAAPNAGASVTICSFSCPTDPSTPGPSEVEWDFMRVLSLAVGDSLSLDVDGDVYLYSPNSLFDGDTLTLSGSDIFVYGSSAVSLIADTVAIDAVPPDCATLACVEGDVYVSVDPPFGDLQVAATGHVYASDEAILFVPEPESAGLLLTGLAVLAAAPLSRRGCRAARGGARGRR